MKHVVDMSWTDNVAFQTELDGHKVLLMLITTGGTTWARPKKNNADALAGLHRN